MSQPDFIISYVADAPKSAALYADLLEQQPALVQPDFAMFMLPNGMRLGLWTRRDVQPKPDGGGGSVEIGFPVVDEAALRRRHDSWRGLGMDVIQPPTQMDFGLTFTAADPDGQRLRVYVPARR